VGTAASAVHRAKLSRGPLSPWAVEGSLPVRNAQGRGETVRLPPPKTFPPPDVTSNLAPAPRLTRSWPKRAYCSELHWLAS